MAPPAGETQAQGCWIGPLSIEPQARRVAGSPSPGPAGCAFSKHKAAGEGPNAKAAEPAACAPVSQALGARLVCRQRAQGKKYGTNPKRLDSPAARAHVPNQSAWSPCLRVPRTKLLDWLINGLIACQGPHLQRLPNTCAPCRSYKLSRTKAEHLAEGSCSDWGVCRLNNSEECEPGREKSETNPSNHPLPLHRQDTSRYNLTGLKPTEDIFSFFFFIFFLFFPFPLNSFFLSPFFLFFIPSSSHPLPFLCLLPAFSYLFLCFNFC